MRAPITSKDSQTATPTRTARGYLGHKRPTRERADLAARTYVQKRPIEAPTLQQLAFAYRVSVASIQRVLNGNGTLTDRLVHSTADERIAAARALGVEAVWDSMIAPIIAEDGPSPVVKDRPPIVVVAAE